MAIYSAAISRTPSFLGFDGKCTIYYEPKDELEGFHMKLCGKDRVLHGYMRHIENRCYKKYSMYAFDEMTYLYEAELLLDIPAVDEFIDPDGQFLGLFSDVPMCFNKIKMDGYIALDIVNMVAISYTNELLPYANSIRTNVRLRFELTDTFVRRFYENTV